MLPSNDKQRTHLMYLDLVLVNRSAVHHFLIWGWALDDTIDQDNRLASDSFRPAHHHLGNSALFLGEYSLDGGELIPQNEEYDLGPCRNVSL